MHDEEARERSARQVPLSWSRLGRKESLLTAVRQRASERSGQRPRGIALDGDRRTWPPLARCGVDDDELAADSSLPRTEGRRRMSWMSREGAVVMNQIEGWGRKPRPDVKRFRPT